MCNCDNLSIENITDSTLKAIEKASIVQTPVN